MASGEQDKSGKVCRIALVHLRQSGTGGTERYLNQIAHYLCEQGHDVSIICRSYEAAPHPAVKFVRLHSPTIGPSWRMWAFARAVERHVARSNYDLVYGLGRAWTHDVVRLGGGCHATYLDLAHVKNGNGWERALAGDWLKHRVAIAIEQRALRPGGYRKVIVNSDMVRRDAIARHRLPPEQVEVVYNGVDLTRFDRKRNAQAAEVLRLQCGFGPSDTVVLFLGTGYGRKGLMRLMTAFARVLPQQPNLRLMVVGYDSAQSAYQYEAQQLGLTRVTRFLGGRRDPEICYAAADVYALPTHYDPFANSTLEALASGLPVITTAANGGAEVLTLGTGSVVDDKTLPIELLFWSERHRLEAAREAARELAGRYTAAKTVAASAAILTQVARSAAA